ncbi:MAG: ribonuclease P protein component [Candidatus Nomurabacteria bacterium]|jgi:ribonuclease P protein component|nr:ribonuclease P protein component [Candidatus Nomurabacteria bacterium]
MLPSQYRFHSRGGVNYTRSHGRLVRGTELSLIVAKNTRGRKRFAVVVSKKVLKSAVGRNRVRRRIYEALRLELPKIHQPVDCLVMVFSSDIKSIEFNDLKNILFSLLKKADIVV